MRRCFNTTISCRSTLSSFLHFPPLSIILFSFVHRLVWPNGLSIWHQAAAYLVPISAIPCSLLFKNSFLTHHPLFSSLLTLLIVPDTQSVHFVIPPAAFSWFFSVYPSILCFPLFLHLTSFTSSSPPTHFSPSPLNSLFWFYLFTLCFTSFAFSCIAVFSFHPSSHTYYLAPTPSLICHFSLLLTTSPLLVYNHNLIAFPLKLCSHTHFPLLSVTSVVIDAVISHVVPVQLWMNEDLSIFKIKQPDVQMFLLKLG